MRTTIAQYRTRCPGTRHTVEPGDEIEFCERWKKWTHPRCPGGSLYEGYGHARVILEDGPHDVRVVRGLQFVSSSVARP